MKHSLFLILILAGIAGAAPIKIGSIGVDTKLAQDGVIINTVRKIFQEIETGGDAIVLERGDLLEAVKEELLRTGAMTGPERVAFANIERMTLDSAIQIFKSIAIGENAVASQNVSYEVWDDVEDSEWQLVTDACGTKPKRRIRIQVVSADTERGWDLEIERHIVHVPIPCKD